MTPGAGDAELPNLGLSPLPRSDLHAVTRVIASLPFPSPPPRLPISRRTRNPPRLRVSAAPRETSDRGGRAPKREKHPRHPSPKRRVLDSSAPIVRSARAYVWHDPSTCGTRTSSRNSLEAKDL